MTYREATELLFEQLPIYQRQGKLAYKADLDNIRRLCSYYGEPQERFPSVHIAGTNGKGSTAHILASILQEAGYRTGLHTQPHFLDLRERIRVDGELCSKEFITRKVEHYWKEAPDIAPSFFELMVALAFLHFAEEKVDIAVVETGMGGRLDATNILKPELSIITNIGHDHMHILGKELPSIAKEKAGIIKERTPVVLGNIPPEALPAIEEKAKAEHAPLHPSSHSSSPLPPSDLKGDFQAENIRTVLEAVKVLREQGWKLSEEAVERGLRNVIPNTGFMGRWQLLREKPLTIADMGHNREAVRSTWGSLQERDYGELHLVFGTVDDKEWDEVLEEVPERTRFYPCQANVARALSVEKVREKLLEHGIRTESFASVIDAYEAAVRNAEPEDIILIGGSTFVVAEFLEKGSGQLAKE